MENRRIDLTKKEKKKGLDRKGKEIEDEALEIWGVKSYRELEGDERKKFFEWIDDANQRFYADLREKEQQANRES